MSPTNTERQTFLPLSFSLEPRAGASSARVFRPRESNGSGRGNQFSKLTEISDLKCNLRADATPVPPYQSRSRASSNSGLDCRPRRKSFCMFALLLTRGRRSAGFLRPRKAFSFLDVSNYQTRARTHTRARSHVTSQALPRRNRCELLIFRPRTSSIRRRRRRRNENRNARVL